MRNTAILLDMKEKREVKVKLACKIVLKFLRDVLPDPWLKFRLALASRRYITRTMAIQRWWRCLYRVRLQQFVHLSVEWDRQERQVMKQDRRRLKKMLRAAEEKGGRRGSVSSLVASGSMVQQHVLVPKEFKKQTLMEHLR